MRIAIPLLALALAGAACAETAAEAALRKVQESHKNGPQVLAAETTESSEVFDVGANYRGTLKKSFRNLGTGTLSFKTLPHGHFSVLLDAHVKHPQSQELIECRVQREYKLDGRNIRKVSENDWFNKAATTHKKRFIDCVSLGYAVKWFTPREDTGSIAPIKFNLDAGTFEITYERTQKWLEATVRSGDGIVGRFFLTPAKGGVRPVDKFRIHAKEELVISFLRKGLEAEQSEK